MRHILPAAVSILAFSLAGCGAPSTGSGIGFDAPGTPGVSASNAGLSAPSNLPKSGQYKTASGVPWKVYQSRSLQRGGSPLSERQAMQQVVDDAANIFSGRETVRVTNDNGYAKFSLSTLDGSTFGVVTQFQKKRPLEFGLDIRAEVADVLQKGIRMAGCKPKGTQILIRTTNGMTDGASMPADC